MTDSVIQRLFFRRCPIIIQTSKRTTNSVMEFTEASSRDPSPSISNTESMQLLLLSLTQGSGMIHRRYKYYKRKKSKLSYVVTRRKYWKTELNSMNISIDYEKIILNYKILQTNGIKSGIFLKLKKNTLKFLAEER